MNCTAFLKSVPGYLGETHTDDLMHACRAHEAACPPCAALMRIAREMSCADFAQFLHDYVEEELPVTERQVFERHIGICPECVTYLESYRTTIALARDAECEERDEEGCGMPEGLVRAILAARLAGTSGADGPSRPAG